MLQQFPLIVDNFSPGYQTKRDPSQLPLGAARSGQNVVITDGDKISPRKGTELLGAADTSGNKIMSGYCYKKHDGVETPLRMTADGNLEYYHVDTAAWENLNDGYTSDQLCGFKEYNDPDTGITHCYFCNGVEPYSRWTGAYTQANGAYAGGAGTLTVDTTLEDQVFYSGTASACTNTTIDIATSDWAADIWNNTFYVYITSGANAGKISNITDGTATQITFDAIAGMAGTPTFEIRLLRFPAAGYLRAGTTTFNHTAIPSATTITVGAGCPAISDNDAVCEAVTEYPENPRGNILETLNDAMFVASTKIGKSTDGNGSVIFRSAVGDATDFTFSSPRAAGEGDIINFVEEGGVITGMGTQEKTIYVAKKDVIKELTYTQDANDLANTAPLVKSPLVGPLYPLSVFRVDNYLYFASQIGGVKTVGRIPQIDFVQTLQISDPIRPTVNKAVFDEAAGIFYDTKAYIACKSDSDAVENDIIFVYNFQKNAWELPILGIPTSSFFIYNGSLYANSSFNSETLKLETGYVDDRSGVTYPMVASWSSGYMNADLPANRKQFNAIYVEGYIARNTTLSVTVDYEYNGIWQSKSGEILGSEDAYLLVADSSGALGIDPLGVNPLGSGDEEESDMKKFRIYLTTTETPFYEASITFKSDGESQRWEVLRFALNLAPYNQIKPQIKKQLA